jgi:tripartite-type tricarboxylate transporter receptor subunit TctC
MGMSRRQLIALGGSAFGLWPFGALADLLDRRRIRYLIGAEGSGGYEAYARLFGKHLALAVPSATVAVEMVETADGRLAARYIFESVGDPLTIGLFESALLYEEISIEEHQGYDLAEFNWLGKLAVDERVAIASKLSGIKTLEDLRARKEPAIYPASTVVSRGTADCYLLNAILDLPIKPVPGYNASQRALAMISGEVQVVVGSFSSLRKLVEDEGAAVILRLNDVELPGLGRSVPLLRDVAPKPVSLLVDLIELGGDLGRWIAAPPTIAPDDLAALRAAFDATVASPAFLAEAAEMKMSIAPLGGAEVQRLVDSLLARKGELRDALKAALACGERRAGGDRSAC